MDPTQQLRLWADELRAIANEGLRWSNDDVYDIRRFTRVQPIAAELFALQETRDVDTIERAFTGDLTHVTAFSCGDAAIFDDRGRILLIQRSDDRLWAMPGGAFEVGETPAEGACREAWEETGLRVEPVALVGVYDSRLCGTRSAGHLYQFVFLCHLLDPAAEPVVMHETLAVAWYEEHALPPLSAGHITRIRDAFRRWRGELTDTIFDR
jgi:8-oxo-dGTP pyrophosphatase MutT (NUDIX family)